MNDIGIFVAGAIVSLLVGVAIALLLWGAVLDGRTEEASVERRAPE